MKSICLFTSMNIYIIFLFILWTIKHTLIQTHFKQCSNFKVCVTMFIQIPMLYYALFTISYSILYTFQVNHAWIIGILQWI